MEAKFKFQISNEDKKEWINVHIIGFTSEVSAVLVPASFMKYGNDNFSTGEEQKITQVMISGKESEFGKVEEMLEKKGLESKDSQMVVGRLKSMVGTLFFVVLGISVIAVFVSGARPGARREIVESYIKRIKDLEGLALAYDGVNTAYAIQAGRELRVLVESDKISDAKADELSFEISQRIQTEMTYPGQVKVTLIREKRAVNYAK